MTLAGRIALFVNLALSLMFGAWGFAVYSNRIDWKARYKERTDEITYQQSVRARANAHYATALSALLAEEAKRPQYAAWYVQRLEELQTGNQPILGLEHKAGQLQLDPQGLPKRSTVLNAQNQPILDLKSIAALNQAYADVQRETLVVMQKNDQQLALLQKLTAELNGTTGIAGLRAVLAAAELAHRNSEDEQEYLKPRLYNRMVEVNILAKLQKSLEARLKELQSVPVARQP